MALTEEQKQKLTVGFNSLDVDRTGFVTAKDYEEKAKSLAILKGYEAGSSEYNKLSSQLMEVWTALQQAVDTDGDQKVSLDEFLKFAEDSGSSLIEDVFVKTADMVFDLADTDGDGNISFDESKSFFLLFESNLSAAKDSFSQMDTDNNGTISKEENRELVRSIFS
ncbi:MAG: EF-hand domain-containing protein [Limnoraphis sp.]